MYNPPFLTHNSEKSVIKLTLFYGL